MTILSQAETIRDETTAGANTAERVGTCLVDIAENLDVKADATAAEFGAVIASATAKTTPVDADLVGLSDSAAATVLKKLSWANIKATLKTYFDTLYVAIGATTASIAPSAGRNYVTDAQLVNVQNMLSLNSGILTGGVVTINADTTKFDVTAGTGVIVNWDNPDNPTLTEVSWGAFTAQTIPAMAATYTRIYIDSNGDLVKVSGGADTPASRRNYIVLPLISHSNGSTINAISTNNKRAYEEVEAINDYLKALGPIVNGCLVFANGANLNLNRAAGTFTTLWANSTIDPQDPCNKTMYAATAASFTTAYRNGVGGQVFGAATTSVPVTQYDNGTGTLATMTNNYFTIHRLFLFATGEMTLVYGQFQYSSLTNALDAISSENFIYPPSLMQGRSICSLIVQKGATDLSNTTQARFVNTREVGGYI